MVDTLIFGIFGVVITIWGTIAILTDNPARITTGTYAVSLMMIMAGISIIAAVLLSIAFG